MADTNPVPHRANGDEVPVAPTDEAPAAPTNEAPVSPTNVSNPIVSDGNAREFIPGAQVHVAASIAGVSFFSIKQWQ